MNKGSYLIYGARINQFYSGCDAYGYAYNEICLKWLNDLDEESAYMSEDDARKAFEECRRLNLATNFLFCVPADEENTSFSGETDIPGVSMRFLGFDVAWNQYDFYSSILHDALSEKGALHDQAIKLNPNGLFSDYRQAQEYLKIRMKRKAEETENRFEEGEFHIVSIWGYEAV